MKQEKNSLSNLLTFKPIDLSWIYYLLKVNIVSLIIHEEILVTMPRVYFRIVYIFHLFSLWALWGNIGLVRTLIWGRLNLKRRLRLFLNFSHLGIGEGFVCSGGIALLKWQRPSIKVIDRGFLLHWFPRSIVAHAKTSRHWSSASMIRSLVTNLLVFTKVFGLVVADWTNFDIFSGLMFCWTMTVWQLANFLYSFFIDLIIASEDTPSSCFSEIALTDFLEFHRLILLSHFMYKLLPHSMQPIMFMYWFQCDNNMQNYQEKPIPLVVRQPDQSNINLHIEYTVNPDALDLFLSVKGKLAVISVAGVYRTGKSYLLNTMLLNRKAGFEVGPTVNPQTKGIWVWGKPLIFKNKEDEIINVLVLDSEGLGSTEEDINHDLRLFSITLLLSSAFLYNTVGAIDENALDSLGLVLRLCEHLKNENFNDFPDFYWILRDFSLALLDKDEKPLTPKEYL